MQYSKAMIDLVKEARRRVPSSNKPAIKLANPNVFQELNAIRQASRDIVLKAIIKELFFLAGEPWSQLIDETNVKAKPVETNYVVKSCRGVTQCSRQGQWRKPTEPSRKSVFIAVSELPTSPNPGHFNVKGTSLVQGVLVRSFVLISAYFSPL